MFPSLTYLICLRPQAAFRDKAMLFHPENNREKDPKRRGIFVHHFFGLVSC